MKGYRKYFGKKILWFFLTLIVAILLNFILPRLMPGDPVANITARVTAGMSDASAVKAIYESYAKQFGTNEPMYVQFVTYFKNALTGDFGLSFSQYPRPVADIISDAIWWTISLQLPAIVVGWLLGNLLGALAAYVRKGFDKVLMPVSLFCSSVPAFGMAVVMLVIFAINLKVAPISGGYGFDLIPNLSWKFIKSVIAHYQLPFWSVVIISIGGQAVGMRSMSIYELNADYVKYSRFLGIKDRKIVGYVFRNAMLPQVTGLALSIGGMVGGALVAEIIFSYPGLGTTMLQAITMNDYPLLSATTLIITVMVLLANFAIDIIYGFIDPRVKAAQFD
ncbi:ABC transporter permease [Lachnospiraceae bacterium MD1]|jgi:peptide/nickel transport system permease protein|uniref:ABC transporter permease n=1 Tax=Variimorphobacter saccharofermentans TaxID=2755051 RepID=A0A839K1R7_9FIRM|nr:ABC transporter permease [Variimorphobacter saccharofermentans]MBB2183357.1 ABC transporter permease [Variimorphobacter saccharofermentans]